MVVTGCSMRLAKVMWFICIADVINVVDCGRGRLMVVWWMWYAVVKRLALVTLSLWLAVQGTVLG